MLYILLCDVLTIHIYIFIYTYICLYRSISLCPLSLCHYIFFSLYISLYIPIALYNSLFLYLLIIISLEMYLFICITLQPHHHIFTYVSVSVFLCVCVCRWEQFDNKYLSKLLLRKSVYQKSELWEAYQKINMRDAISVIDQVGERGRLLVHR